MDQRLRPGQRIRKRQTFQILFEKGKFVSGRFINLWAYDGQDVLKDTEGPSLGIVVSRKTSLRANIRNLWKRRIRETFRKNQHQIRKRVAVMIQSKKNRTSVPSSEEIQKDMFLLLKKTGSLK